jgi:hypothetical protein
MPVEIGPVMAPLRAVVTFVGDRRKIPGAEAFGVRAAGFDFISRCFVTRPYMGTIKTPPDELSRHRK